MRPPPQPPLGGQRVKPPRRRRRSLRAGGGGLCEGGAFARESRRPHPHTHTPLRLGAPARPGCSPRPSPVDQAARSQSPRSFRSPGCHRGQSAGVGRGGGVRATARRAGGGAVALSGRALRGLRAGSGGGRGVPPSWGALGGVQRLGVGPYRGLFSQPLESPAVVCEWELPLQGPPGLRGAREASFPGNALCVCVVLESGRHRTCPLNSTMFVLWCLSNSFR